MLANRKDKTQATSVAKENDIAEHLLDEELSFGQRQRGPTKNQGNSVPSRAASCID